VASAAGLTSVIRAVAASAIPGMFMTVDAKGCIA
jgi:hypothetical protein